MMQSTNTTRTTVGGRAASLAAFAALLVVIASADAAMRVAPQGLRVATDGRPARTSLIGLGRMVEGLLACATVTDAGSRVSLVVAASHEPEPAQVAGTPAAAFGRHDLIDLPPPARA